MVPHNIWLQGFYCLQREIYILFILKNSDLFGSTVLCVKIFLMHYLHYPFLSKLDHAAAIKEYSRSSADQEEPLPHELRPVPVLCMTMDYLVTYIMDQGKDNYRDWYDFVWNRTRGIRKVRTGSDAHIG